jgi:hypothetical protein
MASKTTSTLGPTRRCPLTAFPTELSVKVISMIELEEQALMRLFLVDRLFYAFMKDQESILVRTAANSQDRLVALLALPSDPSYQAFFRLRKEQKIFDSLLKTLHQSQKYARCLHFMRDPNFWKTPGSVNILRAGSLVHHRVASIKTPEEKAAYAERLPHQIWALLCLFERFLLAMDSFYSPQIFTGVEAATDDKVYSIVNFIQELSIFSGLQVIQDFVELRYNPIALEPTTDLYGWALSLQSKYLPSGNSILLPKVREDRLKLSSHLSFNVMWRSETSIKIGSSIIDGFCEHLFDEILTTSGILPPNADDLALFDALKRTLVTVGRYRTIFIEQRIEY